MALQMHLSGCDDQKLGGCDALGEEPRGEYLEDYFWREKQPQSSFGHAESEYQT